MSSKHSRLGNAVPCGSCHPNACEGKLYATLQGKEAAVLAEVHSHAGWGDMAVLIKVHLPRCTFRSVAVLCRYACQTALPQRDRCSCVTGLCGNLHQSSVKVQLGRQTA